MEKSFPRMKFRGSSSGMKRMRCASGKQKLLGIPLAMQKLSVVGCPALIGDSQSFLHSSAVPGVGVCQQGVPDYKGSALELGNCPLRCSFQILGSWAAHKEWLSSHSHVMTTGIPLPSP